MNSSFKIARLVLLACAGSAGIYAGPVTYSIDFNTTGGSGVLPTSGTFTYDSSNVSAPFSAFDVVWEGISFDLTSSANGDLVVEGPNCGTPSPGSAAPTAAFAIMSGAGVCTPMNTFQWSAVEGSAFFANFEFFDDPNLGAVTSLARIDGFTMSPTVPQFNSDGQFTISPVTGASTPEPSSFVLMLTCVSFVLCRFSKRVIRTAA